MAFISCYLLRSSCFRYCIIVVTTAATTKTAQIAALIPLIAFPVLRFFIIVVVVAAIEWGQAKKVNQILVVLEYLAWCCFLTSLTIGGSETVGHNQGKAGTLSRHIFYNHYFSISALQEDQKLFSCLK